jgi:hypothetical protein
LTRDLEVEAAALRRHRLAPAGAGEQDLGDRVGEMLRRRRSDRA